MNILVFGKDGQLGKAFKVVFDANRLNELHCITYASRTECDLSNADTIANLLNQIKPNLIINAAAYTAVDKAEAEVDLAYAINAKAPEVMAMYAKLHDAIFLYYSTDYVFDGSKDGFYAEDDQRNPLGTYGKSKAAGEEAIESIFANLPANSSAQYAVLRTSWVYGDGDNFIRTILRLAKERESLKVIADQCGVPTSATWLAEVSLGLVLDEHHHLKSITSGIYHAAPKGETTWHALACHTVKVAIDAGAELKLRPEAIQAIPASNFPMIAPRPINSRLDVKKIQHVFLGQSNQSGVQLFDRLWRTQVTEYVNNYIRTGIDMGATA
ncbi:dTDP-4-dehydrorhamnose reductase [Polynucleobacter sp.]|uniref:dTDP-4-dehydrorhamnose reductase n=1 Tax=Polynucleobacter sp. TaxID=2029855 RepID=UPI002733B921|nr:dTDP-4-dehydrorhamnose reductase [Polynucleobacter sp.]MDP3122735.1 dTDP-4-dehydrorhamnose reductase [Polynucleobacter sp.]